jgi:hypothetical protein
VGGIRITVAPSWVRVCWIGGDATVRQRSSSCSGPARRRRADAHRPGGAGVARGCAEHVQPCTHAAGLEYLGDVRVCSMGA